MWQSCVEIKGYSVAHFDHIIAFEELYCQTSLRWDVSYSAEVNENINLGYSQDHGYS